MSKRTLILIAIALLSAIAAYISLKADRKVEQEEPEPEPEPTPRKKKNKEPEQDTRPVTEPEQQVNSQPGENE